MTIKMDVSSLEKVILDSCYVSKMFWFDKDTINIIYMDKRELKEELFDGRKLIVNLDSIGDFRKIPFEDKKFRIVVFDPLHLESAKENSWLSKKYGKLNDRKEIL